MIYTAAYDSPLGPLTLRSDGEALTALHFGVWKYAREEPEAERRDDLSVFRRTAAWLDAYFARRDPGPLTELSPQGSEFRRQVWAELRKIPYGRLTTYGAIAAALAERTGRRMRIAHCVGPDFALYSGNDDITVPLMAIGGSGVISVYANVMPRMSHELSAMLQFMF